MSISEHEQQALETIEDDLASTGPKLAAMLAIFTRLTAGEEMPRRERVRRVLAPPLATASSTADAGTEGRPARFRQVIPRLRRQSAWLVWVIAAVALIAWMLTFDHGAGKGACLAARTAACRQVSAPAGPGGPGHGGL